MNSLKVEHTQEAVRAMIVLIANAHVHAHEQQVKQYMNGFKKPIEEKGLIVDTWA